MKLHDLSVEDRFSQCLENILGNSVEEKKKNFNKIIWNFVDE